MSITGIPISTLSQDPFSATSKTYQQNFVQLGQDLKSGNIAAAQQDLSALQEDLQSRSDSSISRYHHHHRLAVDAGELTKQNSLLQQLTQLGQDLASGNLSAAQQAYVAMQDSVPTSGPRHYPLPPSKRPVISAIA